MITELSTQVHTGKIDQLLDIIGQLPGNPGFKPVLSAVGQRIQSRIQLGFRNSKDPWGGEWRPLSYRQGKPLVDTGRLRSSVTYFANRDQVRVGTNVVYAAVHQFGSDKIPARPFMPLDENGDARLPDHWEKSVLNAIHQHIEKATANAN